MQEILFILFEDSIASSPARALDLASKEHNAESFMHKLARMRSTAKSSAIAKKYLELIGTAGGAKAQTNNFAALKLLLKNNRPADGEVEAERDFIIAHIAKALAPAQVRNIRDAGEYTRLIKAVVLVNDQIVTKKIVRFASSKVYNAMIAVIWPLLNDADTQAAFVESYNDASLSVARKRALRSALLNIAYSSPDRFAEIARFFNLSDALQLKKNNALINDEYSLPQATIAGNFRGNLLKIFTDRAMEANTDHAYAELRELALLYQAQIPAHYAALAGVVLPVLENKLTNSKIGFANYYLNFNELEGLALAAESPTVSNANLNRLFNLVLPAPIDLGRNALLAQLPGHALNSDRFLHHVARRAADAYSSPVLLSFIGALGAQQQAIVGLKSNNKTALALLLNDRSAQAANNPNLRQSIQALVALDDGTILRDLNNTEVLNLINPYLASGTLADQAAFRDLATKLQADPLALKRLRSALLQNAYNLGPVYITSFLTNLSAWGLKVGLKDDEYSLENNPAAAVGNIDGSLLYVLAQRATQDVGAPAALTNLDYDKVREYAGIIKTALGADYDAYTQVAYAPMPNLSVVERLEHALPNKAQATYYLHLAPQAGLLQDANNAAITNAQLKNIYNLVIDSVPNKNALAAALAAERLANTNRFLHELSLRQADADILEIMTKFLASIKADAAARGLVPAAEAATVVGRVGENNHESLAILLKALAQRPAGEDQSALLNQLSLIVDAASVPLLNDLSDAEYARIAKLGFENRAVIAPSVNGRDFFKATYNKVTIGQRKATLRSALLSNILADANAVNIGADMQSVLAPADAWGLAATADMPYNGADDSLLSILTQWAITKHATQPTAYDDLKTFAAQIKNSLGPIPYVTQAIGGPAPLIAVGSPLEILRNQLDGHEHKPGLAELTLGVIGATPIAGIDVGLIYRATDTTGVHGSRLSNKDLRDLYWAIIGNKPAIMAQGLSITLSHLPVAPGPKTYVHRLVERPADADTAAILDNFLQNLQGNASAQGVILDGARTPLQILMVANGGARVLIPAVQALSTHPDTGLQNMIGAFIRRSTLNYNAMVGLNNLSLQLVLDIAHPLPADPLTPALQLIIQQAAIGNAQALVDWLLPAAQAVIAKDAFKHVVTAATTPAATKEALRSALLEKSYEDRGSLDNLIGDMVGADEWGLGATVSTDIYKLASAANAVLKYDGPLLYVLAARIHEERVRANGALPALAEIGYEDLETYARVIKPQYAAAVGAYQNAFTVAPYQDPITGVQTTALATLTTPLGIGSLTDGQAKYVLDLNEVITPADIITEAAISTDNTAFLTWLYDGYVGAHPVANAVMLNNIFTGNNYGLLNLVARLPASQFTADIFLDFLLNLAASDQANGTTLASSALANNGAGAGLTPLELLLDPNRATRAAEDLVPAQKTAREVMIAAAVHFDLAGGVGAGVVGRTNWGPLQVEELLDAIVARGDNTTLHKAFAQLPINLEANLGAWVGNKTTPDTPIVRDIDLAHGNLPATIPQIFHAATQSRGNSAEMRNALVKGAYERGFNSVPGAPIEAQVSNALKEVATLFNVSPVKNYWDESNLSALDYEPWANNPGSPGGPSNILYALLFKASFDLIPLGPAATLDTPIMKGVLQDLTYALKDKLQVIETGGRVWNFNPIGKNQDWDRYVRAAVNPYPGQAAISVLTLIRQVLTGTTKDISRTMLSTVK
jgi:hypothetical protein